MLPGLAHRIAAILIASGIVLGGFGPSMAVPGGAGAKRTSQMEMMPGMDIQPNCMTKTKCTTEKEMPCDGTDCGCCLAGTCAAPIALNQAGLAQLLGRTAENEIDRNTILDGITFPPALPPPIG